MGYEDYWIKRANARMSEAQKGSDETIKAISDAYSASMAQLNKDINRLFYRFSGKYNLTQDEAAELLKQTLNSNEIKKIREQIDFIEDADIKRKLIGKLNATIYKARITRLEALKEDIYIQCSRMADAELRISTARYTSIIQDEFLHNVFDMQQHLGYAYSFSRMPVKTVKQILQNDWSGKHYSRRIWENSQVNGKRIEDTVKKLLLKGAMTGTNSRKMAKELDKICNTGMYACERLIRTETTYFVSMADKEEAKQRGTKKLKFVATLDARTSKQCREHDERIISIKYAVPGKTIPPLHPFCRSVVIEVIPGLTHKVRIARNPKTGKNYKVPADMTYQEWKKSYVDNGLLLTPDIKNPVMKKSMETFEEMLDRNDDGSNLFNMIRMCKNNVAYTENKDIDYPFAYNPNTDEIVYNSSLDEFKYYDMNLVYAHELAHRLDVTWCQSWKNQKFLKAIDVTRKKMYDNFDETKALLKNENLYNDNGFSDILSAISNDDIRGVSGHTKDYWSNEMTVPAEIFANLVMMKVVGTYGLMQKDLFLKELFDTLKEMV